MHRRVVRATEQGWEGVEPAGYSPDASRTGVSRHTIVGSRKSERDEPGPQMELRYFEVQPGAASRLEKHEHEHYVIVHKGLGYAVIGDTATEIGPNDVIYVGPLELHQFVNRGAEPFGFYCFVDTCRDFSQPPTPEELARLEASPAGAVTKPFAVPPPAKR
ncbi:MAG TPA: cupin domain-containing protein [Candidatus Cybelea sp.]|jgi:mannose-6-phosphate isomerase-like protein (cupin superfamily)|nr:cupin domain-containing protein [Candidatus Cybelea sp.]